MKTSVLRQTSRTEDNALPFAAPALLLAVALALCGVVLLLGALPAEPAPAATVPVSEPASPFVGA